MKASVQAFLEGIVDYAGLFPPAGLSLDTSIHNYRDYRQSQEAWMLGRFVIPAARLEELKPYDDLFEQEQPYAFSVLGKGTDTVDSYRRELKQMVEQVRQFHDHYKGKVTTEVLEVKLPREVVLGHDGELLQRLFEESIRQLEGSDELPHDIFFEAYLEESWKNDLQHVLQGVHRYREQYSDKSTRLGFKLRCGGLKATLFPSLEQVAFVINGVREYDIPLKCTAGLHHPVRHYSDSVATKMHGFLNIFGGTLLHKEHNLSQEDLLGILQEEDAEHFSFTEGQFCWGDYAISVERIAELRRQAIISFGSCSFDEPREDLRELDLL